MSSEPELESAESTPVLSPESIFYFILECNMFGSVNVIFGFVSVVVILRYATRQVFLTPLSPYPLFNTDSLDQ